MSTMVHHAIYSAGEPQQMQPVIPSSVGVSGVGVGGCVIMSGGGGYSVEQASFGDGCSGGNYVSMAYDGAQHPLQQQAPAHQIQMKPSEHGGLGLGGHGYPELHHQQHHHHQQQHYHEQQSPGPQLQLPLTEPLLQQCQQQVAMATASYGADDTSELPATCSGGPDKKRRNPPTVSTGRRSLKSEKVHPAESHRREKRRERNRVAAAKCRQKRQDRIECLSEAVRDLEADNAQLEASVSQLAGRRAQLIGAVQDHRLQCPNSAELQAAASTALEAQQQQQPPQPPQPPPRPTVSANGSGNSTDGFGDANDDAEADGSESCLSSSSRCGGLESSFGSGFAFGGVGGCGGGVSAASAPLPLPPQPMQRPPDCRLGFSGPATDGLPQFTSADEFLHL